MSIFYQGQCLFNIAAELLPCHDVKARVAFSPLRRVNHGDPAFVWNIPSPFLKPWAPTGNPMNVAKVELGRLLFDDTRLSVNGQQSCASCHRQEARFLQNLRQDTLYRRLVAQSFPSEREPFTMTHLVRAIAAFERTLISLQSSYGRYRYGADPNAISESAKRGEVFFFSDQRSGCRFLFGDEYRHPSCYGAREGHWQVSCADPSEHRGHRALHARRQHVTLSEMREHYAALHFLRA